MKQKITQREVGYLQFTKDVTYLDPRQYRLGSRNIVLFINNAFLILPRSEVHIAEDGMLGVDQESLKSALDVTPDLPPRVIGSAWKHGIVFQTEVKTDWAAGVARSCALSASEIVGKFMEV